METSEHILLRDQKAFLIKNKKLSSFSLDRLNVHFQVADYCFTKNPAAHVKFCFSFVCVFCNMTVCSSEVPVNHLPDL